MGRVNRSDRILDLIDAGLQSTTEAAYEPGEVVHDRTLCTRCHRAGPVEGIEMCLPCRSFLLGDSANDPLAGVSQRVVVVDADEMDERWVDMRSLPADARVRFAAVQAVDVFREAQALVNAGSG